MSLNSMYTVNKSCPWLIFLNYTQIMHLHFPDEWWTYFLVGQWNWISNFTSPIFFVWICTLVHYSQVNNAQFIHHTRRNNVEHFWVWLAEWQHGECNSFMDNKTINSGLTFSKGISHNITKSTILTWTRIWIQTT